MKKHLILILVLALILIVSLRAESDIQRHSLSLYAGGTESLFEIEYQYSFLKLNQHRISACIGVNSLLFTLGLPLGINYSYGDNHQFILGLRIMPFWAVDLFPEENRLEPSPILYNLRIGYGRKINLWNQDYSLSIFASPTYDPDNKRWRPWGGLGIGAYF